MVLALPWTGAESAIKGLGALGGKVVLDCMNPLTMGPDGLALDRGFTTSGGETVASATGSHLDALVKGPGAYRIEAWLDVGGESRPWIYSNPIYVR